MKPRCRTAFTLVELLVVITIIGMLAALLLPAINHAREAARSAQCMNNQRNLGLAIQEFDSKRGYLPGYRQFLPLKPLVPDNNLNPIVVVGWQVMLWQYSDRPDLFQNLQGQSITSISNNNFTFPYIDLSVCPSDNTIASKSSPWTSYVVNTGRMDQLDLVGTMSTNNNQTVSVDIVDPPQTCKPIMTESFANGVFQDRVWFFPNQSPYPPKKSLSDIKDGQGNTLMLSENLDTGYYTDGPGSDSPMLQLNTTDTQDKWTFDWYQQLTSGTNLPHSCTERGAGFVWWDTSKTDTTDNPPPVPTGNLTAYGKLSTAKAQVAIINGRRGDFDPTRVGWPAPTDFTDPTNPSTVNTNFATRPSSNHPGGVNVVFADGTCHFLSDDIDYSVYCLLMTPTGATVVSAGSPTYPPTSSTSDPSTTDSQFSPDNNAAHARSWQKYSPLGEGQF